MKRLTHEENSKAWELAQRQVELGVKLGHISREEARDTINGARASYRANAYNKSVDKILERRK